MDDHGPRIADDSVRLLQMVVAGIAAALAMIAIIAVVMHQGGASVLQQDTEDTQKALRCVHFRLRVNLSIVLDQECDIKHLCICAADLC